MNRVEQLMVRQEWESRHQVPILRIAALCFLSIVLGCVGVLLFHLLTPAKAVLIILMVSAAAWPVFALGRSHARLIRRRSSGNI